MSDDTGESKARSLVIFSLYAIGIGLNVYLLLDQLTDGQLSREMSVKWTNVKSKLKHNMSFQKQLKKDTAKMLWQAMEATEGKDSE